LFAPALVGLIAYAQGFAGLRHSLALAEQNLGFTEFADILFGGVSSPSQLTVLPCLIQTQHLDQLLGGRSAAAGGLAIGWGCAMLALALPPGPGCDLTSIGISQHGPSSTLLGKLTRPSVCSWYPQMRPEGVG
jgi:hypothetical protein